MQKAVILETIDNIGIIKVTNPPVNALSFAVRSQLLISLDNLLNDSNIDGIILIGEGRTFVAGADISEFGKPMKQPDLNSVISKYEKSHKPIVAALHGTPLGGGLELAMGCNYRIALDSTKLGLPEVKLGIIPGAGGNIRLPRLVGPVKAIEMIISGTPIIAKDALNNNLIDQLVTTNLLESAIKFITSKIAETHPIASERKDKINNFDPKIFEKTKIKITKKMRGRKSPLFALKAIEYATSLPFKDALIKERELFKECHDSEESSSLIHMFFSEREATKIPDIPKEIKTRNIKTAAVIGCGTMGGGIAMNFANIGIPVLIIESNPELLEKGLNIIKNNYKKTVEKGRLSESKMQERMSLITGDLDLSSVSNADIIIEAVFEEMKLKKELFAKLDQYAKNSAILASNTSTLDIDAIANSTSRPGNVIGTHFFSPANVMKLLEVVRGSETNKDVIASTMLLGKKIKKVPVLAGNCDGFIGNRMFHEYIRQAHALAEEGALVADIDRVIFEFGWAMGPFAVNDLAGNDVGWRIRKRHKDEGKYDNLRYTSSVADRLCEMGRYGQKTGRGFYIYNPETREKTTDPEVDELYIQISRDKGIKRRNISDDEILNRLNWSLVNTGCMILEEGYALRASDIDVVYTYGYGYPSWRGGPMKYAEHIGLSKVVKDIELFRKSGDGMWPNCSLLEEYALSGKSLSDFKYKN